jgi:glutamate N-acetyltransferase / amino-acid N-acetyltransferase
MGKITCKGFKAAGVASGIKPNKSKDLGLIFTEVPAAVAGVFTRNQIKAAPVLLDQKRLKNGSCQAVVANSSNANCYTGVEGMVHAKMMARAAANALNLEEGSLMVASTGVIGQSLPIDKIEKAVPDLAQSLSDEGFTDFAEAIMTTDTVPKISSRKGLVDSNPYSIIAVAKGAGMIRPDMATMLCFICTDAKVDNPFLQETLTKAVNRSLNCITIDGDTSTNDTVLLLANGASGAALSTSDHKQEFTILLNDLLMDMALKLVKDGEGVTKVVRLYVYGAADERDAKKVVDTVAHSPLVKTAFFGQDANWGRIMMAVGRSGAKIAPERIDLYFDQIQLIEKGSYCGKDSEKKATNVLKKTDFIVTIDLNIGNAKAWILTCDLSLDYVRINADYRS